MSEEVTQMEETPEENDDKSQDTETDNAEIDTETDEEITADAETDEEKTADAETADEKTTDAETAEEKTGKADDNIEIDEPEEDEEEIEYNCPKEFDDTEKLKKMFVGGLTPEMTDEEFHTIFKKFGEIENASIMRTMVSKKKREEKRLFGFVTYKKCDSLDDCLLERPHRYKDTELDVKRAVPKDMYTTGHFKVKRLHLAGILTDMDVKSLRTYLRSRHPKKYGSIGKIEIIKKRRSRAKDDPEKKRYGYITVSSDDFADRIAFAEWKFKLDGRNLKITKAKPDPGETDSQPNRSLRYLNEEKKGDKKDSKKWRGGKGGPRGRGGPTARGIRGGRGRGGLISIGGYGSYEGGFGGYAASRGGYGYGGGFNGGFDGYGGGYSQRVGFSGPMIVFRGSRGGSRGRGGFSGPGGGLGGPRGAFVGPRGGFGGPKFGLGGPRGGLGGPRGGFGGPRGSMGGFGRPRGVPHGSHGSHAHRFNPY